MIFVVCCFICVGLSLQSSDLTRSWIFCQPSVNKLYCFLWSQYWNSIRRYSFERQRPAMLGKLKCLLMDSLDSRWQMECHREKRAEEQKHNSSLMGVVAVDKQSLFHFSVTGLNQLLPNSIWLSLHWTGTAVPLRPPQWQQVPAEKLWGRPVSDSSMTAIMNVCNAAQGMRRLMRRMFWNL